MSDDVANFFNREADEYNSSQRAKMWHYHQITARKLQQRLSGEILAIGGLWRWADLAQVNGNVTVADVSDEMLQNYQEQGVCLVQCDARALDFEANSFNHVVLPLLLHHITGSHSWSARGEARLALSEAARVLKPGGHLWISDFVLSSAVYAAELAMSPVTKRMLGLAKIPLVVMHSTRFYVNCLRSLGFYNVSVEEIESPDAKATDWIQPVIGLRWLTVPRALYPIRPALICASR